MSVASARSIRLPYVVVQDEDGAWCASAQLRPGVGAVGEGLTREAAIADLKAGLELLIEETGVPDELTITRDPPTAAHGHRTDTTRRHSSHTAPASASPSYSPAKVRGQPGELLGQPLGAFALAAGRRRGSFDQRPEIF